MARDQHGGPAAVRITTAATSRNEDISARQRRYVISMTIRTLCFVSAILVGPGWLRWVLVAGAVLLPYLAVVMANATTTRTDGFALQDGDLGLAQLTEASRTDPPDDPATRDGGV